MDPKKAEQKRKLIERFTNSKFSQGFYEAKNPEKYMGDHEWIIYRSSWEQSFNQFLDNNPNVIRWGSEEFHIKYIHPYDGKLHKYYPDYLVEYKNTSGEIVKEIIEIKPANQVARPKIKKRTKNSAMEEQRWYINQAKWRSAQFFCDKYGYTFRILTENELFSRMKQGNNNGKRNRRRTKK